MPNPFRRRLRALFDRPIDSESVRNSGVFCILPWVHLHVGQRGEVVPCCQVPPTRENSLGNIRERSFQEIWNGEAIREFRRKLLSGTPDPRCSRCYDIEKVGASSLRKVANQLYQEKIPWAESTDPDGRSEQAQPIYWDIRFSNFCNFKCRICGFESSSRWHDDAVALGQMEPAEDAVIRSVTDFRELLDQLDEYLPSLQEIYFAGGEPLIMEEHYEILRRLEERQKFDVLIRYNTNFSTVEYKGRSVLEIWKKFDFVMVNASLDGSDARGELQRSGQVWSRTLANRQAMLEICPDVQFTLSPTVSVFNAWHLPDFHREWVEKGLIGVEDCVPTHLRIPEEYSLTILPASLKQEITRKIESHVAWIEASPTREEALRDRVAEQYRSCIRYMNSADDSDRVSGFLERCEELDRLRGESVREIFPELRELWG